MKTAIVLICDPEQAGATQDCLQEIRGRSLLGHSLDRIRHALPGAPVMVACSGAGDVAELAAYCRRALLGLHAGAGRTAEALLQDTIRQHGLDGAIGVDAGGLFADIPALRAAHALLGADAFDHVDTPDHPAGTGLMARRAGEGPRRHALAFDGPAAAASMDLRTHTDAGRRSITRVLARAGAAPATLGTDALMRLAADTLPETPWRGAAGPLMIAEIGGNHEGDFEVARKMAEQAIGSGADCVKFQLYTGATLVSPVESPIRHAHFRKFELEKHQHIHLAEMCREAGVGYVSSVWDEEMLEWIDPYMEFYKVGSGDMTAWPLLRRLAERGKPILLSTGLASMDEVLQTVAQIQDVDARYCQPEWMCVMQCTAMYPIPDHDAHLRVMDALRAATGLAVGYSDHTIGAEALKVATAMGAEALEFHFTDSREGKTFRDHKVSLVAEEVQALKKDLVRIAGLRGSPVKVPQESELAEGHEVSFRRAAYLNRDVKAGEVIREEDIVILRPAHGTDARDAGTLAGRTLLADVPAYGALVPGRDY